MRSAVLFTALITLAASNFPGADLRLVCGVAWMMLWLAAGKPR